ncbi:5-formyltetrahydrofolate cyclo-ligase [Campylobacterota bacterium]|nr:5-formyltetrahydrofolate cyclo-ligase [Campylobacterota bacterium]
MNKQIARQSALAQLKARPRTLRQYQSALVRRHLTKLLRSIRYKNVLIYLPMEFEAAITACFLPKKRGVKIYAPFIEGVSFKMVEYRLPLKRQLGIFAPTQSTREIKKVDVMIVPVLAVDAAFKRIGFGRGMYDRFVAALANKPIVIFVQPFLVQILQVITGEWDIRGDFLVSAKGVIQRRGNQNDRDIHRHSRLRSGMR